MHWLTQHSLIVLGVLVATVAVIFVLQQRRTPQSAAAWILFIVIVPYVAIPVFLMLGFRKRGSRFPAIRFTDHEAGEVIGDDAARMLRALGAPPGLTGNSLDLHVTSDAARNALEVTIDDATETIDVLFYIVAPDAAGRAFVERLTCKARQGVEVRLNLDRLGTFFRPKRELADFAKAGGQVRYFSPFLLAPDNGHMNLRNHRKLVIADNRRVWAGGRNVGLQYLGPETHAWNDLSYSVSGPIVQPFIDVFASDWDVTGKAVDGKRLRPHGSGGSAALQLLPSGPDVPGDVLHDGLVNLIHGARIRIWLATPYFVPTEPLQQALSTAARRGADVRIFVPETSNQCTADLARGGYLRELEEVGATVKRYQPGMLHAKAGIVDDIAWTGSANFDVRSLLLNFELALFAYDPGTVSALERWFNDLAAPSETGVGHARLPRRVVEGVFRLGAPVL